MSPPTGTNAGRGTRRAALEEERDLLLRSLDDLEVELAAGDLDRTDYESLRDAYTARAADVLRQLSAPASGSGSGPDSGSGASGQQEQQPRVRLQRRVMAAGVLLLFALVAGFALARAAGERGVNDTLTGGVDPSSRTRVLECQNLGSTGGDLVGALECFDEILNVEPENAEALTYRGWYLLLAAGSLQQTASSAADEADAEALIANGLGYLDRAIAANPELPDPLAFRATVLDRQGRSEEACADIVRLRALEPPQFFLDQTAPLAERNGCP